MRVACIQLCSNTDIDDNIAKVETLIRAAHAEGARFIVTPENTHFMGGGTDRLFASISTQDMCQAVVHFSALARELSIDLLIGSLAIRIADRKAANRSFHFGPDGEIKAHYDKIHLFDVDINETEVWRESDNYRAGTLPVISDVGDMKLGMSICYDVRFAALYKYYARAGAHILSVPAAFTAITGEAHWDVLLRSRAIETSSYVIAPAQGGVHENGRATWGHSMIVDPWGKIISTLDHDQPGFCVADIDLATVTNTRSRIPAWQQNDVDGYT